MNGRTKLVAVLGHPIAHTASPAMHNAAFKALDLNWAYVPLDVHPDNLKPALIGLAVSGFAGVNLTVPHKILALPLLDQIHPTANILKATNTLRFISKKASPSLPSIEGFNTDGYGLLKAIRETFPFNPKGKTIAILGCGGAGRSAAIQMALAGVSKIILLNRTRSKAQQVAQSIRQLSRSVLCEFKPASCHLLIQATSLGLQSRDPMPASKQNLQLLNPPFLYEMIYRPAETPFMKLAARLGIQTCNGLGMLLHQGAKAFEIWTGRKAPLEIMRKALKKEIYGH